MSRYPKGWTPACLVYRPDHRNKARWTEDERIALQIIADLSGVSPDAEIFPEPDDADARALWETRRRVLGERLEYRWAREPVTTKTRGVKQNA